MFLPPAVRRIAGRAAVRLATALLAAAAGTSRLAAQTAPSPIAAVPGPLVTQTVAAPPPSARLRDALVHERWTERDGAPPIPIVALHEGRGGFLWVGTEFGALRFDGAAFARPPAALDRAIGDVLVRAIAQSSDGTLWLTAQSRGLVRWANGVATVIDTTAGLPDHDLRALHVDAANTVWIGSGSGLARLRDGRVERVRGTRERVQDMETGPDGTLWVATPQLTRLRGDSLEPLVVQGLRPGEEVFSLHRARDGAMWLGTVVGLLRVERAGPAGSAGGWRVAARYGGGHGLAATYVRDVREDARGRIWATTSGDGALVVADGAVQRIAATDGLSDDDVQTVHVGSTGSVWVGTRSGLDRFRARGVQSVTQLHGLQPHFLWSVAADGSAIWFATNGGGVYRRDADGTLQHVVRGLASDIVYGVMPTADGTLWIRTSAGLARYRDGRPIDVPYLTDDERAGGRAAFVDRGGALWLGGTFGVVRAAPNSVERLRPGVGAPTRPAQVFAQTADGTVWMVGSDLVAYRDGRTRRYASAEGVEAVTSLAADGDDVWAGTYADGLLLVRDGRVYTFTDLDLPRRVYAVILDRQDGLWLSTNVGLRRVSRAALAARAGGARIPVAVRRFDQRDGLWNVEFNVAGQNPATVGADGRLWFASAHGAVWVDPARLPAPLPRPTPLIEVVLHDGAPYLGADSTAGRAAPLRGRGALEVRYTAPSLLSAGRVLFRHRLVGYDTAWVDAGQRRTAVYAGVPGGHYRFEVQASLDGARWSTAAVAPVDLQPHLAERWWARAIAALLGMAALVAVSTLASRRRTQRLHRRAESLAALVDERTHDLQALNEQLEQRVADRTAELRAEHAERLRLQDDLQQAQRLDSIGRLAGGVAHDLNNMLTAILAFAELAEGAAVDEEQRGDLHEVRAAGQRASRLTQQLLAFARRQAIDPRVLDLRVVVGSLATLLRRVLGADVEVAITTPDDLWAVRADASQIEQILMNLAVNARDAMPDGGRLTIELANGRVDDALAVRLAITAGEYVRLSVADTGTGMPPEVRRRLFEPFFTTKEPGKGTGLGLATCYGIATQAGGGIDVHSAVDTGTRFDVWLPRTTEPLTPPTPGAGSRDAGEGVTPRGETVLLVDDEEPVRAAARRVLAQQGYAVVEATDGEHALGVAEAFAEPPALLLCDMVMPRVGGVELTERLRARWPDLRVLLMTGYAEPLATGGGTTTATAAVLQKPFTPAVLAQRVRDALQ